MARSTVHYHDNGTNKILKALHNKLRPAGTPIERVEYIIELLLLRIFEVKLKQDDAFKPLRRLFEGENYRLLFSYLKGLTGEQAMSELNKNIFPFYANILTHARKVIEGNLPTKIHDHLVLTEEVFANSSFTNNVKGGLMSEIVSLVSELDEQVVLKSDLLGDAIESALSETGGTKDIGLYRTPGHIRKMMVEMVDPDLTDVIHDPACGTGGFLFDAYEYIIANAENSDQWPSDDIIEHFYRSGLSGVEYQGRIRKMAAVNMYIRGLNPHNIEQGDSLKLYDPSIQKETCTVVIANPPFGAECDQPAYPNVWEEYSREKETTILFVKLMFELLKKGGRCAVVVSEGFLTWGQNSAGRLRQMLLQEANLRAIISLPQGVFVSKNGQGPKTSILYFEKGTPTNSVWYYKIENDGFSMGTNRQTIEGSQIPELLEKWKTVKQGLKPEDTRHSFCIPRQWIETLDPRIKERIRKETRTRLVEKDTSKKAKFIDKLEQDLNKKKISKDLYKERLSQYNELFEIQVQNTITKEIEKAHTYHFNLQNYRSGLTDEQIKRWQEVFNTPSIPAGEGQGEGGLKSLDKRYTKLFPPLTKGGEGVFYNDALEILSSFDPRNALEIDIAREFLHNLPEDVLTTDEKFKRLEEIVRKGFHYPLVPLKDLIIPQYEKLKKEEYKGDLDIVDKISFADGKIHLREQRQTGMDLYIAQKEELITSKINLHQGAIAVNNIDRLACSTHYQVYHINHSEVIPDYLVTMMRSARFLQQVASEKNKGIKNEAGYEFIISFLIPLPPLEIQREIVAKIETQKVIIEAALRLEKNYEIYVEIDWNTNLAPIGKAVIDIKNGWSPRCEGGAIPVLSLRCLKNGKIDFTQVKYTDQTADNITDYYVKEGDFFYSRGNTKELVALAAVAPSTANIVFPDLLTRVEFDKELIIPQYAAYLFNSPLGRRFFGNTPQGASASMVKVSQNYMKSFLIPYLGNLNKQQEIVAKLDKEMEALEGVRVLRQEAERRIEKIIAEVWGEGIMLRFET